MNLSNMHSKGFSQKNDSLNPQKGFNDNNLAHRPDGLVKSSVSHGFPSTNVGMHMFTTGLFKINSGAITNSLKASALYTIIPIQACNGAAQSDSFMSLKTIFAGSEVLISPLHKNRYQYEAAKETSSQFKK